MENSQNTITA
jgi:hypothetical protein